MDHPSQTSSRAVLAAEKRRRIFDAAREVIMRKGYDGTTMEEIALGAAVGKGTLYNFFASKDDLFLSLVLDGFERIRELVDAEVEPFEDPWERFAIGWRALMLGIFPQLNQQWPLIYQLWGFLARDAEARERMFAAWRALYRDREHRIVTTIAEGQESGRFAKRVPPSSVALLLMATFDGLLHRAMFDPERVDPETVLRDILGLLQTALEPTSPKGKLKLRVEGRKSTGPQRPK
jgi:AcrR family transcriptional regulator